MRKKLLRGYKLGLITDDEFNRAVAWHNARSHREKIDFGAFVKAFKLSKHEAMLNVARIEDSSRLLYREITVIFAKCYYGLKGLKDASTQS